jgi:hypothetical protein
MAVLQVVIARVPKDRWVRHTLLDTSKMRTPSNSAPRQSHSATSDTWAVTTTTHGRLMSTALGDLAEFERSFCDPYG